MADSLKGITVEIGGDTLKLQDALKDANSSSKNLQGELKQVERLLKFDPGNVDLLAQREEILNQQITQTQNKLQTLRSVYSQVQGQFERGELGADQWRRFQREVIQTEQRLQSFQGDIRETEQVAERSGGNIKDALGGALAGAVAGAGAGAIIQKALDTAALDTTIKMSFQVPEEAIPIVKDMISSVTSLGVEGEAAIEGVRKQLALNLQNTDEQNAKIIESAGLIARSYQDIDFTELIQESNEFADAIGIGQQDALNMTNALLRMGFPPDQLDIMSEYGSQLHRAGYNAQEIQGIFAAGVETKSWNIDVLLDGVKEGRIVLAGFSEGIDDATAKLIQGTGISAQQLEGWGAAVAAGGEEGKVAFGEVALKLSKINDEGKRNALGSKLFGTLWEEQGKKITESMMGANTQTGNLKKNADIMNAAFKASDADPQKRLNDALSNLSTTLTPLLATIAEWVAKLADWAAKNPEIVATVTAVGAAIGILMGIFAALAPIVTALIGLSGTLGITVGAMVAPVLAVIAVLAALIAIGVLVWKNWDTIVAKAKKDWGELIEGVKTMGRNIAKHFNEGVEDIKEIWGKVMKFFKGIDLKKVGADIMNGLKNGIAGAAQKIYDKASEIAGKVIKTLKNAFSTKSPSKITHEIGLDVGAGLTTGLEDSVANLRSASVNIANGVINTLDRMFNDKDNVVTAYFEAIQEDGDWLNDMLVHMPKKVRDIAVEMGKILAPDLEGTRKIAPNYADWDGNNKYLSISINSPKALDTREATREFNRTLSRMSMYW